MASRNSKTLRDVDPFPWLAVGVGLLAGVVLAGAPALPIVHSDAGSRPAAIGAAAAVAAIVALVPPIAAAAAALLGRLAIAGGLLGGGGAVAAAMAVDDLRLFGNPIDANRFELIRPVTASTLSVGLGAYAVIGAHILAAIAGMLGTLLIGRAALADDSDREAVDRVTTGRIGAPVSVLGLVAAAVWGVCLFVPAWTSVDPVIVTPLVVSVGATALAATIALAVSLPAVVAGALASVSPEAAAGAIVGAGLTALGVAGTRLAAGIADPALTARASIVIGTVAAVIVIVVGAFVPSGLVRFRVSTRSSELAEGHGSERAVIGVAALGRWHPIVGAAGVATSILLGVGALLPILTVTGGEIPPPTDATRVAIVAAALLLIPSIFMFLSEFAAWVRPMLGPILLAVVLAAAGVLQAAVTATRIPGVGVGIGSVAMILGVAGAAITGAAVWIAGAAERDETDRSVEPSIDRTVATIGASAAALSVLALALPLYRGSDVAAASFAPPWGFDSWAQALLAGGIVAVAVVAVVAPRARSQRAVAMLVGSASAMAVYLSGWPLTIGRLDDASVGFAVPAAVLAIVALLAVAVLVARSGKSGIRTDR